MAGGGKGYKEKDLKNQAMLVVRNVTQQEVTNVIFPNGITVGVDKGARFRNGFRVHGDAQVSGVVNAQGFRVNGAPLEFGDPFISLDLNTPAVTYGSDNQNEQPYDVQARGYKPSEIEVTVFQSGQETTLTEGEVSVVDANGVDVSTGSFSQNVLSEGSSFSSFVISLDYGSSAPVFPITASLSKEGISSSKLISKTLRSTNMFFNLHRSQFDSTFFGRIARPAENLFHMTTDPSQGPLRSGKFGNGYDIDGTAMDIDTEAFDFQTKFEDYIDSSSPGLLFYRQPPGSQKVVHNIKGSAICTVTNWDLGSNDAFEINVGLYKTDSTASTFTIVKTYDTITATGNGTQTLDFGTDYTDSLDPFVLGEKEGLSIQLLVSASQGFENNSSSTANILLETNLFLESGYE